MFPEHLQCEIVHGGGPLRIVQITDCHLERVEGGQLLGMDTDDSLSHVLKLVREQPAPDVVLATGDLASHGAAEAYLRFKQQINTIDAPVFWLAGNHDDQARMEQVANGGQPLLRRILIGAWQILLLDSTVPGQVGGTMGAAELDLLATCLEEPSARPSLICLHHHPVPIGCAWLDQQLVSDADELFALLDRSPEVRGLLWGHVHQQFDSWRGHMQLMCSPSTCIQFAPDSADFAIDSRAPGYRWLNLHADGSIETGIRRVEGVEFSFDADSTGYV